MKNQFQANKGIIFLTFFLVASFTSLFGATKTWTGAISTDWSVTGNWLGGSPVSGDDVIIPTSPSGLRMPAITSGTFQVKSLTIQAGATLSVSGGTLTLSGANSSITGTLNVSGGTILITNNCTIETNGLLSVSNSGLIHMASGTASVPSDNIIVEPNGQIQLSGGTIYVKDLTTNAGTPGGTVNQTGGTFRIYHDFKNKGVFNATGGTIQFSGDAGGGSFPSEVTSANTQFNNVLVDAGVNPKFGTNAVNSFNVSGNWTNNSAILDLDNKANTTIFNGSSNQVIGGSQTTIFRNLTINKPGGYVLLAVNQSINSGNLLISAGILDLDGYSLNRVSSGGSFIISNGGELKLGNNAGGQTGSNFPANFATYSFDTASRVDYDAATTQTIFAGVNYGDLSISNSTKIAGGQINVNGVFSLNAAVLNTTNTNLLVLNDNATVTGAAYNAYVNGPVKKIGNDAFTFPVGKDGTGYMAISISGPSSVTDAFTAEYIRSSASALGSISSTGLKRVSNCDYWNLTRNIGTSPVNVTLSWNGYSNCNIAAYINDLSALTVAHFNGSSWDTHAKDQYTGNASSGTVTRNAVSVFSPFAIGSTDEYSNPLSIITYPVTPIINQEKGFSIFPVPATTGSITLQNSKLARGNYFIQVINLNGQVLTKTRVSHAGGRFTQSLDLSTMKSGIYQLLVEKDGVTVMNNRFIIQ